MKGFKIPNISIPSNISIPNISVPNGLSMPSIDVGGIKSAIESAIPDLSSLTADLNLEDQASSLIQENLAEGIELPSELKGLIK